MNYIISRFRERVINTKKAPGINLCLKSNKKNKQIAIFEGSHIRRHWDEEKELWYFSLVDVISALTDSVNPRDYWFKMKIRVKTEEGAELSTFCRQLKLPSADGKS